jgi:hypothetical protein
MNFVNFHIIYLNNPFIFFPILVNNAKIMLICWNKSQILIIRINKNHLNYFYVLIITSNSNREIKVYCIIQIKYSIKIINSTSKIKYIFLNNF